MSFGCNVAPQLQRVSDNQTGLPVADQREEIIGHPRRQAFYESADLLSTHVGRGPCPYRLPLRKGFEDICRAVEIHATRKMLKANTPYGWTETSTSGERDLVPALYERPGQRNHRMKMAKCGLNCEQDPHCLLLAFFEKIWTAFWYPGSVPAEGYGDRRSLAPVPCLPRELPNSESLSRHLGQELCHGVHELLETVAVDAVSCPFNVRHPEVRTEIACFGSRFGCDETAKSRVSGNQ